MLSEVLEEFNLNVSTILHIGAHKCEELNTYHSMNISNKNIIWIEANKKIVDFIKNKDNTILIYNYAVSDIDDQNITFHITNNGQSSSILELGTHQIHYPHIKYIENVEMKTKTVDTIFKIENIDLKIDFLNIDIQGAELLAFKGMNNILNDIKYILTEINVEYVYKNCCLLNELDDFLTKYNFKRVKYNINKDGWGSAFYMKE